MAEEPDTFEVRVAWLGVEDVPVFFANQFVSQVDRGEVFLTIGQLVPPALLGTEEQRRAQAEQLQYVPVKPVARIAFTPQRLTELISVLQITQQGHEQQEQHYGDPRNT